MYSSKFTHFEIFTGRKMNLPIDSMIQFQPAQGSGDVNTYMRQMEERIQLLHKIATENIQFSQQQYKKQYDKNATACDYAVGTKVWLYTPTQLKKGTSKKMQIKYNKLVCIKEKIGDNSYKVIDNATGVELKFPVHVDNL